MEEDTSGGIDFEYFMEDMSEERSTRVAGAIMIIIGSLLGVQFGILQISGTPDEILSGSLDFSERYSDVNGITISSLEGNSSGGDPVEWSKLDSFQKKVQRLEERPLQILMDDSHLIA